MVWINRSTVFNLTKENSTWLVDGGCGSGLSKLADGLNFSQRILFFFFKYVLWNARLLLKNSLIKNIYIYFLS